MWNENWLVWLHLISYLSCYEENEYSLCFLVTFAICHNSVCWQPCWKMWSLIRLIAFPYFNPLILDHYYCTLLLQSLFFLNPSADKLLKEDDSVYGADMPQSLPARLSSSLYGFPFSPYGFNFIPSPSVSCLPMVNCAKLSWQLPLIR